MAAACPDPRVEAADRPRLADRRPARLDQRVAGPHRALLRDPPVGRRAAARLVNARVEPEVADQLAWALEPTDLADRGEEGRGADRVDARNGHQPPDLGALEGLLWRSSARPRRA